MQVANNRKGGGRGEGGHFKPNILKTIIRIWPPELSPSRWIGSVSWGNLLTTLEGEQRGRIRGFRSQTGTGLDSGAGPSAVVYICACEHVCVCHSFKARQRVWLGFFGLGFGAIVDQGVCVCARCWLSSTRSLNGQTKVGFRLGLGALCGYCGRKWVRMQLKTHFFGYWRGFLNILSAFWAPIALLMLKTFQGSVVTAF